MLQLKTPEHAGSRQHANALLSGMSRSLAGQVVTLDCGRLLVATPSFFDEIVKQVLVVGGAARLDVLKPSQRARELVERAATNRGVSDRLSILAPVL
jgi:hypothetical protein